MATFSGEIEDDVKAGKEDFETTMKDFKEDVEDILGLAKDKGKEGDKEKGKGKDKDKEKAKQPTLEKFNTTVKKQFLQWLEFQKALEEMQGNPASAAKAMHQIQEVKAELKETEADEEAAHDDDEEEEEPKTETRQQIQEVEESSKVAKETPQCTRPGRLSRVAATKGKWFG